MYDGFIYETTCTANGMKYRGQHKRSHYDDNDPDDSWYLGSPTNPQFWKDLERYGRESFIREIIDNGPFTDYDSLARAERYRLEEVDAANNTIYYNRSNWSGVGDQSGDKNPMKNSDTVRRMIESNRGNQNRLGKSFTELSKQKISESLRGEKNPNYGGISESHRLHISESKQGEKNPMYGRVGESSPRYGKVHSEETRKKMSENRKGKGPRHRGPIDYHMTCVICGSKFIGHSPRCKYCSECKGGN